jgi:hypothetical protein
MLPFVHYNLWCMIRAVISGFDCLMKPLIAIFNKGYCILVHTCLQNAHTLPFKHAFLKINQMLCNSSINLMQMDEHQFLCIFCKCSFTPLIHQLVAIGMTICFRKTYKSASHLYVIYIYIYEAYKLKLCYSVPMQQVILTVKTTHMYAR